ncbi:CRISPR-associated protein Cas4 [[Clostridium] leptum]|nr:CRISPR-associated protein Cas4 [[Clostridium] leptum]
MEDEENWLQISGIQHFVFCRRQWALAYLEGIWSENLRTVEGHLLHQRAHDSSQSEKRGDKLILRGLRVFSAQLGVSGECDVVEFTLDQNGVPLAGYEGNWQPYPVEYKRGTSKQMDADRLQLCCQAMCLEEMLCCDIPSGALFYGESRRREVVSFSPEMRDTVRKILSEMHDYARRGHTPRVKPSKACNACSLKLHCLPAILRGRQDSASSYLKRHLTEEEGCS